MSGIPSLVGEPGRLAALEHYDILDTPAEQGFDDVVLLAAQVCETAAALVSLVAHDRQWFKARTGFSLCETPIEQSVCAHALAEPDILVIPDLTRDPRTRDNALVTGEPRIRFYAGAPLLTPEGLAVGTLCVIDGMPRPAGLTPVQASGLRALARQVMVQLELRRAVENREQALAARAQVEEQMRLAADATGIGIFDFDPVTQELRWDARVRTLFGVPQRGAVTYAEHFLGGLHPDDRAQADAAVQAALDPAGPRTFDVEYRVIAADTGAERWLAARGQAIVEGGRTVRFVGTVRDVTVRKANDARRTAATELGDRLRETTDPGAMAYVAAEIMGRTLSATRAGYGTVDVRTETVVLEPDWRRPGVESIAGQHRFRDYGSFIDDLKRGEMVVLADVATDPRTRGAADAFAALSVRTLVNVPLVEHGLLVAVLFIHHDRPHVWTEADLAFVRGAADRTRAAIARARAEEQQRLLAHELSHRLKNTLAMVQAIVNQTLRNTDDLATAQGVLAARLIALGKAHDILMTGEGESADIRPVIEGALRLHDDQRPGRFHLAGPPVPTGAKAALSLSLMMHELATNAAKYGALSGAQGSVSIVWAVEGAGADAALTLTWQEAGGPPVHPPARRGFGSRLIARGLAGTFGGEVDLAFPADGVTCRLRALLSGFQHDG